MTLRLKRRASKFFTMTEGRKSQIVLLDDRRLDIIIQPKLYSSELLDLVASHFKLREKHYFGLGFLDDTNHFNWLQGEKRVLDHEFPKKTGLLVLHFAIRFYVETIGLLRDTQTVELFYLNARQALFRGQIECDTETVFELAAHVLQATNGDFVSEEETREELKKLPVIPTSTLKEHPSIAYCEDRVINFYEKINGTSRGLAIVNYMTILEKLPTYGIHYYDVKDKKDIPWWLGISPKGIAVYDKNDKTTPRKLFTWKNLENLYYRDKKFSIEVHGPKREATGSQVSVSRRTFGASNVDVHAWFASTPQLTKCIWSMAVAQHQFYLDRKQSKSQLPAARSMSEIAAELCRSTTSLPGSLGSDISRSPSSHSLPSLSNSRYDLTIEQSDSLRAEKEMYQAQKARKEALEEALRKKTEELKNLCLQEAEITGELPKELPLAPGEQLPVIRRRVGTTFSLSVKNVLDKNELTTELSTLELEVELQSKITSAALRLASDKTVSKYVRKQRKQSYAKAQGKLKDMEKKLGDMRKRVGKSSSSTSDHQNSGRVYDGMYHVVAPGSKRELDLDHIIVGYVHDNSARRQDDSCGNSLHSEDSSVTSELAISRDTSCGNSPSVSCANSYRSSKAISDGYSDDTCSFNESLSPGTPKSVRDDTSSGFHSMDLKRSPHKSYTGAMDEDLSQTLKPNRRKKHFIVSRGVQNARLKELKRDINRSQSNASLKSDTSENLRPNLARAESDDERGSWGDEDDEFDNSVDEYEVKLEEQRQSSRVLRRKQTFIISRGLTKQIEVDRCRSEAMFERGFKTFEHILMGEEEEVIADRGRQSNPRNKIKRSLFEHKDIMQKHTGLDRSPHRKQTEVERKIQELIDSTDVTKPLARSRSFDYNRDMRVLSVGRNDNETHHSKDDLKLSKSPSKHDEVPVSVSRKPFAFLTKKRNKPKQMKHSVSDTQALSVFGCVSAVAIPVLDSSPRHKPFTSPKRDRSWSHEPEQSSGGTFKRTIPKFHNLSNATSPDNVSNKHCSSSMAYSNNIYPRSTSAAAVVSHGSVKDLKKDYSEKDLRPGQVNLKQGENYSLSAAGHSSVAVDKGKGDDDSCNGTLKRSTAVHDYGDNDSVFSNRDSESSGHHTLRRRSSWHSSSRSSSITTNNGMETRV